MNTRIRDISLVSLLIVGAILTVWGFARLVHAAPEPPSTRTINVVITIKTNAAPTNAPMPIMPPQIVPLSLQMRMAAQLARGKAAPWAQRFIATAVEEKALTRAEDDGPAVFSTNYLVTVVPVADETNAPVTWGASRSKAIRFYTTSPTKKGDEFELFPVKSQPNP